MTDYKGPTDKIITTKLESAIEQVIWKASAAAPKGKTILEVFTKFVGNNSDLTIDITDKSGKKFETLKEKIFGNKFWKEIIVPEKAKEELYAEVKLPKHGLNKKSNSLYLFPEVIISNTKWEKPTTFLGDVLKIKADIKGLADGNEAEVQIWEHNPKGIHDLITKFPGIIKNKKVEAEWEFQFNGTVDEVLTQVEAGNEKVPQFFYRIVAAGVTAESDLILMNWLLIELIGEDGKPIPDEQFIIELPDKTLIIDKLDKQGRYFCYDFEKDGNCKVSFPDIDKDAWEEV